MEVTKQHILNFIEEISGETGILMYHELKDKENVDELILVEKLEIPLNRLRHILYIWDSHNLLSSNRKKDRKKGWYIYFWTFLADHAKEAVVKSFEQQVIVLKQRLHREEGNQFYICPNKCTRATIENAMEETFLCPECGSVLTPEDNMKSISTMQRAIARLEEEIATKPAVKKHEEKLDVKPTTKKNILPHMTKIKLPTKKKTLPQTTKVKPTTKNKLKKKS